MAPNKRGEVASDNPPIICLYHVKRRDQEPLGQKWIQYLSDVCQEYTDLRSLSCAKV
jgi:hypothetical protein